MPLLTIGGLWAASALGFLYGCDPSPSSVGVQASGGKPIRHSAAPDPEIAPAPPGTTGEQVSAEDLVRDVEDRARRIARALDLAGEDQAVLLNILLHEADRLDAARTREQDPLMKEALEDYRRAVAEWKARELQRSLGVVVAERIASYESGEAARITITPANATSRR